MASPAAVLAILVKAETAAAQASLLRTDATLKKVAASSEASAAKSAAAWQASGQKMKSVGRTLTTHVSLPIIAAGGYAIKSSLDFNKAMTLIQTQAGASAKEVERMREAILKFGESGQTAFSPTELAQGLYAIESAGIRGAKALKTLKQASNLAIIGQTDLASTTKALAAAQKTGIRGSGDLKKAIGTLNATVGAGQMHMEDLLAAMGTGFLTSAKQVGLSMTDVGGALAELTKQGIPAAAAATRLRMTFTLMAAPTSKAVTALASIGLSQTALAKEMQGPQGLVGALTLLQDHLSGLSKIQQTQLLSQAFGGARSGTTIMALLGNLDDLDKTLVSIHGHAGEVNKSLEAAKKTKAEELQLVWAKLQATLVRLGDKLIPIVIPALERTANVVIGIVNAFNKMPKWAADFLIGAVVLGPLIRSLGAIALLYGKIRAAATGAAVAETAAGAAGAGGAVGAGASAKTATGRVIGSTAVAGAEGAGVGWGAKFASAAKGKIIPAFGPLSLAVAGAFAAQPLLKKFHEIATKAADDFPKPFGDIGQKIADIGIPTSILPKIDKHPGGLLGLLGVGKDTMDKLDELAHKIRGAGSAVRGLDKILPGISSKTVGDAIQGLIDKYGSLVNAGHNMSKKQRQAFIDMAIAARDKGLITQKQLENVTNSFTNNTEKWRKSMRKVADATGESMKSVIRSVGDMKVKVSKTYDNMVKVTFAGTTMLVSNTNKALKALGVRELKWQAHSSHATSSGGGHPVFRQRGGMIGGAGDGDKVPVMAEPGEGFINKKAVRAMGGKGAIDAINKAMPRFAGGGFVGMQPGITKLIKNVIGRFGGSMSSGFRPGDPGFHGRGMAADWVGGDWMGASRYINSIGPSLLEGIHQAPPGQNVSWDSGHKVSPSFWGGSTWAQHISHIHMAISGMVKGAAAVKKLERVLLKGPKGPLRDMGQAALDKTWKAANALIAKKTPTMSTDSGLLGVGVATGPIVQMAKQMVNQIWGAGQWGPFQALEMSEAGWNPKAVNARSGAAGLAQALPPSKYPPGAWPYHGLDSAKLQLQWMMGYIKDRYGSPSSAWAFHQANNWYQKGGVVGPYVGSFEKGGRVARDGLAHVHKGEHITPPRQSFDPPPWIKKLLHNLLGLPTAGFGAHARHRFHALHRIHDRSPEQQKALEQLRLRRRTAREQQHQIQTLQTHGGPRALQKTLQLIQKYGVNFSKGAEKRLKDLEMQRRHGNLSHDERRQLHHLRRREERFDRQQRIEKDTRDRLALEKELITEFKELKGELKTHNRLVRDVRVNERAVLRWLSNPVAAQIGAQGLQKRRNAGWGVDRRY